MLTALQCYYAAVCAALFLYALHTPARAVHAFVLAMAANVFPLALVPYTDMDVARLGGMPLVYLPVTAVGLAMIVRNGLHLPRRHLGLYVLMGLYLAYTFGNTVLARGISATNLVYWLAWPLNFLAFIAAATLVARMDPARLDRLLRRCVQLLVAASVVGLARYASGFESDANFIPLMNRNGTVVLTALLFPLVLHVHETQGRSRLWLLACGGTIALCVALMFSRSGLVGLMAGMLLYYGRWSLMGFLKLGAATIVVALFVASGVAERSAERLVGTAATVEALIDGREPDRTVGDHNRIVLVNSAIATAKAHFWFGTGLGMENYRDGLRRASPHPVTSKSHNFYLSYFVELGLVGFLLLLAVLRRIHASLPPGGSRYRAFRVGFLVMALMMTMNEYILLPELWVFFGMGAGLAHRMATQAHTAAATEGAAATRAWRQAVAQAWPLARQVPRGGHHG